MYVVRLYSEFVIKILAVFSLKKVKNSSFGRGNGLSTSRRKRENDETIGLFFKSVPYVFVGATFLLYVGSCRHMSSSSFCDKMY